MPVLMYELSGDGNLRSQVVTSWSSNFDGEEHRSVAEDLDVAVDGVLDLAVELWIANSVTDAQAELIRMWAVGRAVTERQILDHPAMDNEYRINLWRAMEQKALLGIRSDGLIYSNWGQLRSKSRPRTTRNDQHLFDVGLWIQQQTIAEVNVIFCGRASNAQEMSRRQACRSLNMRRALGHWIENQDPQIRHWIATKSNYLQIPKAIVKRWPAHGPGSAKRPEHYSDERLNAELRRVLGPVKNSALAR